MLDIIEYQYQLEPSPMSIPAPIPLQNPISYQEYETPRIPSKIDTDPYSSWTNDPESPLTKDEIRQIFVAIATMFGFQSDNTENMYDHLMVQLDSRASRMSAPLALLTIHADYIGGSNANYKKWYFCCQQKEDPDLFEDIDIKEIKNRHHTDDPVIPDFYPKTRMDVVEYRWRKRMSLLTPVELIGHLSLYLQIWGESNNLRFAPECLCFVFQCALDHMTSNPIPAPDGDYLDRIVTPLYNFYRDQQCQLIDGQYVRVEKDHCQVIGYDDINQLFWYHRGLKKLVLPGKAKLIDLPRSQRYAALGNVLWNKAFYKTYKETRSWIHLVTDFSRIWIIHLNMFWYYSVFNSPTFYTAYYEQQLNNQPTLQAHFSAVALGSVVGCLVTIAASIGEYICVPRQWPGSHRIFPRITILILVTSINLAPSIFVLGYVPLDAESNLALLVSIVQFVISVATTLWISFQPLGKMCQFPSSKFGYDPMQVFTASYPKLDATSRTISILLWIMVFGAKFIESYFFLTLSIRDPIRDLHIMDLSRCEGESIFGNVLCVNQAKFTLVFMYIADMVLFFLDTYLWYIIWNCLLSLSLSFASGISILSPWRNVFARLPQRIYSKLLSTADMEVRYQPEILISQVWNAIIISLYREHLLSSDHVHRLIYDQLPDEVDGKIALRTPPFFLFQDDSNQGTSDFFLPDSQADRRLSFFAQSLSTAMPEPIPVEAMPTFTVLIPHYGEKILLGLREIIREDPHSKLSLLEYLKQIFPDEWQFFVRDTKILACNEDETYNTALKTEDEYVESRINDLPLYCIGFKSSEPEYTLRTRIWASLRSQTLYRTISGFMNYKKAIKLLHRVENPEMLEYFGDANTEAYLNVVANRKFRMLVAMQRLQNFTGEENNDLHVLARAYPDLKISCLEVDTDEKGTETYYSALYEVLDDSKDNRLSRVYRIRLSGNPILGDGKSDNQNNSIIFYRGEYLEVIDANQDNYLEECLKIRSVLAEFENMDVDNASPYVSSPTIQKDPVAILGAREYIFSEHTGVLGDVAASKEQTFGTMFSRSLAQIGAKLHYGHPDFINAIFMTTRGGISKAQKGLHLNEDIYAGMIALCRGGRIKHCDYFQCGKGRDLGFGSILNFTTKIGSGMGEQMLSREYYYLGTQMPLDRFLSFYYAHPGFHLNNLFIMLSLELFMLVAFSLGSMKHELITCAYNKDLPITDLQIPLGCHNLEPVLDWVTRYVLSIFICFFISFLPLFLHELSERGIMKACSRLLKHFTSLSPFFEVFVCQIYATSLKNDIVLGGAQYISTGRGFAISRVPFYQIYSSYAPQCIYVGIRLFLVLLFAVLTMWQPAILWFWITFVSLCFSPFMFNPHQFAWTEYFLDYRDLMLWFMRGNSKTSKSSWVSFTRDVRSRITGFKKQKKRDGSTYNHAKPLLANVLIAELGSSFGQVVVFTLGYTFINAQSGVRLPVEVNSLIRLGIVTMVPFALNSLILLSVFPLSCLAGPVLTICCDKGVPGTLAAIAHIGGIVVYLLTFQLIWVLEGWNTSRALAMLIAMIFLQRFMMKLLQVLLTRELRQDHSNGAWWSGRWIDRGVGWQYLFTQPLREFLVKVNEMSHFAADFLITHVILFCLTPALFIPYIDRWQSSLLLWIKPSKLRGPVYTVSQQRKRNHRARRYAVLYLMNILLLSSMVVLPIVVGNQFGELITEYIPKDNFGLVQPNHQDNNDTGSNAPLTVLQEKPRPHTVTKWVI